MPADHVTALEKHIAARRALIRGGTPPNHAHPRAHETARAAHEEAHRLQRDLARAVRVLASAHTDDQHTLQEQHEQARRRYEVQAQLAERATAACSAF